MNNTSAIALAALLSFSFQSSAQAVTVQGIFSGVVSDRSRDTGGTSGVSVGDAVSGSFSYDTETAIEVSLQDRFSDFQSPDEAVRYVFPFSSPENTFELQFGELEFETSRNGALIVDVINNSQDSNGPIDDVSFGYIPNATDVDAFIPDAQFAISNLSSRPRTGAIIEDGSLPTNSLDFNLTNSGALLSASTFEGPRLAADVFQFSLGEAGPAEPSPQPSLSANLSEGVDSSEFALGGSVGARFDRENPTVIISHGRNPEFLGALAYSGDPFDIESLEDAHNAIRARHPGVNVVLVTWEGAFVVPYSISAPAAGPIGVTNSSISPLADTFDTGVAVADQIYALLGDGYSEPIHVIGHSYGAALNNVVVSQLTFLGAQVDQVTVLDAPTALPIDFYEVLEGQDFELMAAANGVEIFDNYYATEGFVTGGAIEGAYLDGGFSLATDHAGVFEEYIRSISEADAIPDGGFSTSVAIAENDPTQPGTPVSAELLELIDGIFFNSEYSVSNSSVNLIEGSDAYAYWSEVDLTGSGAFSFLIDQLSLGEDDWFEIILNGSTVAYYDGGTIIDQSQVFIPLRELDRSASSSILFFLSGNGDVDAEARFSNISTIPIAIAPVPLPSAAWFLLAALFPFFGIQRFGVRSTDGSD